MLPCQPVCFGHLSHVLQACRQQCAPRGDAGGENLGTASYLCRAGCVLCCASPVSFPSAVMSLQISAGDCSGRPPPALGGAVFCFPGPSAPHQGSCHLLLPCPWPFSCSESMIAPVGPAQPTASEKWHGVNSCFRPFFVQGQWVVPSWGGLGAGGGGAQCPTWPSEALCRPGFCPHPIHTNF